MPTIRIYFESMAGTHLLDAIDALRDAGSTDALYDPEVRATPRSARALEDVELAEHEAEGRRMAYSRRALLFAAFAAEAYVNDFLYEHVQEEPDRKALVMMPTVEKYILLPKLLRGEELFSRNRAPWNTLKWLFSRRDELVHAKPSNRLRLAGEDPDVHNPRKASEAILAVADSAIRFDPDPDSVAATVHHERGTFLAFGKSATATLPSVDDPPAPFDLFGEARRARRER